MVNFPTIPATAAEIRANTRVHGTYLVRRKVKGVGKTGKPWLQLVVGDKSGTIDARVWDNADAIDQHIAENDVVDIEGNGVQFMDQVQLRVTRVTVHDGDKTPSDFLPESAHSSDALDTGLAAAFDDITHEPLRALLAAYRSDAEWWGRFLRAPAAKSVHHAWVGGLAEHTLSMMRLARQVGTHYVQEEIAPLDVDVLVTGAFLHDSGKVEELSTEDGFAYTDVGRLIGHIQIGIDMLDTRVAALDSFPPDVHQHLRHLVLSHHGEYEYGSPRRPKTIEAILLHFIDNMDARVAIFHQAIHGSTAHGNWSGFESSVGRHIYRKPIDFTDPGTDA